jgi:hypothetical protein
VAHDSDSREAEIEILKGISGLLGKPLGKRHFDLPGGTWVEVDGVAADLSVFAEAFAHQGAMKGWAEAEGSVGCPEDMLLGHG